MLTSTTTFANSGNLALVVGQPTAPWIIDSGANAHMSDISSLFSHFCPSQSRIVLANGSFRPVLGTGDLRPTKSVNLSSSLFVTRFLFNLLSVSQNTKLVEYTVTFYPSSCIFQDLRTKKMIGLGHKHNGLYCLDLGDTQLLLP